MFKLHPEIKRSNLEQLVAEITLSIEGHRERLKEASCDKGYHQSRIRQNLKVLKEYKSELAKMSK